MFEFMQVALQSDARYWHDQITHGVAEFAHMLCDDGSLVEAMRANGILSIPHGAPARLRVEI